MRRFPDGLLVIGDAICSFNPIYGQGMTVAALQALALRDQLRPARRRARDSVLRALARAIDVPWELAIGADLAVPEVDGPRPPRRRAREPYVRRLQAAASRDPELSRAFVRVTGLIDPPEALLRPATALRVLRPRMSVTRRTTARAATHRQRLANQARPQISRLRRPTAGTALMPTRPRRLHSSRSESTRPRPRPRLGRRAGRAGRDCCSVTNGAVCSHPADSRRAIELDDEEQRHAGADPRPLSPAIAVVRARPANAPARRPEQA